MSMNCILYIRFKIIAFFIITLYVWVAIFLICVPLASQKSERSCIFVFGLSILPLSVILLFDFGTDPILLYFRFLMNGGVNILCINSVVIK